MSSKFFLYHSNSIKFLFHLILVVLMLIFFFYILSSLTNFFEERNLLKRYKQQATVLVNNNFEVIFLKKENVKFDKETNTLFYVDVVMEKEKKTISNENTNNIKMWNLTYKEEKPIGQMFTIPGKCQGKKIVIEFHEFNLYDNSQPMYVIGASCS